MRHVMIVGQRAPTNLRRVLGDQEMRAVLACLHSTKHSPEFAFAPCTRPEDLVTVIGDLATDPIDLLDIYYHGAPGRMCLGGLCANARNLLFASNDDDLEIHGAAIARDLRSKLAPTAHVRLLGCKVGLGPTGRRLLVKLAYELGESRVVFAPFADIYPQHFGTDGTFRTPSILFSSLGALDRKAPSVRAREVSTPWYPCQRAQRKPSVKSR